MQISTQHATRPSSGFCVGDIHFSFDLYRRATCERAPPPLPLPLPKPPQKSLVVPDIRTDCNQDWLFACARLPKRFVVWKTVAPSDISRLSVTAAATRIFLFLISFAICPFLISPGPLISGPRFGWPNKPQMPKNWVGSRSFPKLWGTQRTDTLAAFRCLLFAILSHLGRQTMVGCKSCLRCSLSG